MTGSWWVGLLIGIAGAMLLAWVTLLAALVIVRPRRTNIAMIAKTDQPNPKLPGTIHNAARQITEAGSQACGSPIPPR
jgi:hypothetical protein